MLLAPIAAFAFDADVHMTYTKDAVSLYLQHCQSPLSERAKAALIAHLAHGAWAEDETERISRSLNWHFYNRDGQVESTTLFNKSLDAIFARRVGDLERQLATPKRNLEETFVAMGRVLHYIQDMVVPAHVVPIYHVKFKPFIDKPDGVDGFRPTTPPSFEFSSAQCALLRQGESHTPRSFRALLDAVAQETLTAIGQGADSSPSTRHWLRYWPTPTAAPDPDRPGYALYGDCRFLREERKSECGPERLDAFYRERYNRVIEATIRVIIQVEPMLR